MSYGLATILVQRRAADIAPEALAGGTTAISAIVLAPFALLALPDRPEAWASLGALGVLGTAVALLAFYQLINLAGSNRAGLVTYVNPVVAVLLGVALLDERVGVSTAAGFALIAAGCWLSTRRARPAAEAAGVRPLDRAASARG